MSMDREKFAELVDWDWDFLEYSQELEITGQLTIANRVVSKETQTLCSYGHDDFEEYRDNFPDLVSSTQKEIIKDLWESACLIVTSEKKGVFG